MNGFPETYSVDPESTGQKPHDQIDNLIDEHEGSSLFNLLSFLTELAPGYSPLERMGEKETFLQKAGEVPTFLMGLGLLASPQGVRKTATKLGAKRVLQEFGEEVADPLYHNAPLKNLVDILKEGNLKGHPSFHKQKERSVISFTRNPRLGTGEAKGTATGKHFQTNYGPAQIIVSKEEIKNLGKIEPSYLKTKKLSEEVLFTPLEKRVAKVPTEKFEGIHIDNFIGPGGDPRFEMLDKEKVQYITELMREAHKRKVPIILGPEATETFYKLGMDKKLPKTWQGRLVVDIPGGRGLYDQRTMIGGEFMSEEIKAVNEKLKKSPWHGSLEKHSIKREPKALLDILDKKKNLGVDKKTGKRFWAVVVDSNDGKVEQMIPYSKAKQVGFHHRLYVRPSLTEKLLDNKSNMFYIDDYGNFRAFDPGLEGMTASFNKYKNLLLEQIEILPSPKPKLPGP